MKDYQSENDLRRHLKKIHGEILCDDCKMDVATSRCEKGSYLCHTCGGIHVRDGHVCALGGTMIGKRTNTN